MKSPWFMTSGRSLSGDSRLFCFPFAGGGATFYRQWHSIFEGTVDVIPVQLPGRENRIREPLVPSLEQLTDALGKAILPWLGQSFSFFGYSMGALIAYELARWLRQRHGLAPDWLFVAGRRPPHFPPPSEPFHDLPDEPFWSRVRQLEGTPEALFDHPELLELLGPVLRNDLRLCDTYSMRQTDALESSICAFSGRNDGEADPDSVEEWSALTRGVFEHFVMDGGHFFIHQHQSEILTLVQERLNGVNKIA